MADIYDRVEDFIHYLSPENNNLEINRELYCDNHVCRLEISCNKFSGNDDIQELQYIVCEYIMSNKYSVMIDHIEYAECIIMVDIFDSEGLKAIFGHEEV